MSEPLSVLSRSLIVQAAQPCGSRLRLQATGLGSQVGRLTLYVDGAERAWCEGWQPGTRLVQILVAVTPAAGDADPTWGALRTDPRPGGLPAVQVACGLSFVLAAEVAALLSAREPGGSPLVYTVGAGLRALAPLTPFPITRKAPSP